VRRTRTSSERGVALVAVIFFALVAMAYTGSALTSVVAVRKQARYQIASQRAHEAAESGVHRVLAMLSEVEHVDLRDGGEVEGVLQGSGKGAIRFVATLEPAGADGADNDQDGRADEADEADLIEVRSTGYCDRIARTVRVTLLARYRKMDVGAATYLADPLAQVGFNGNSFLISGFEHDLEGNQIQGAVPGIGVPGSPLTIVKQLKAKAGAKVVGQGASPSVHEVDPLDLKDLIEEGARAASVELKPDTTITKVPSGAWGTLSSPSVIYAPGNIHISGNAEGAGILIVDGNLTISGGFQWVGLVIVRGEVTFSGGGAGKRLTGALIVERNVITGVVTLSSQALTVNGTVDVLFSNQAVNHVMRSFATYTLLNWREGPNPDE